MGLILTPQMACQKSSYVYLAKRNLKKTKNTGHFSEENRVPGENRNELDSSDDMSEIKVYVPENKVEKPAVELEREEPTNVDTHGTGTSQMSKKKKTVEISEDTELPDIDYLDFSSPVDILERAVRLAEVPLEPEFGIYSDFHYADSDVSFNITRQNANDPLNLTQSLDSLQPLPPADSSEVNVIMQINRGPMAFRQLTGYFKDPSIMYKVLTITRVLPNGEREIAEDSGGVLRDLLTEYWTSFYELCTLGRDAKVPSLRHDFGAVEWEAVARILVYGYR